MNSDNINNWAKLQVNNINNDGRDLKINCTKMQQLENITQSVLAVPMEHSKHHGMTIYFKICIFIDMFRIDIFGLKFYLMY